MTELAWLDSVVSDESGPRPFREAFDAVLARLGDPSTVGDGPFARWVTGEHRVTVTRSEAGSALVDVVPADSAADEERSSFDFLEIDDLPYSWRADVYALLPSGSYLPGEHLAEDIVALGRRLHAVGRSIYEAVIELPILEQGFNLTISDRRSQSSTQWSVIARPDRAGSAALVALPDEVRDGHPVRRKDWVRTPLTADGVYASLDLVLAQIAGWNVTDAEQLSQRSYFTTMKRTDTVWSPTLIGLGIPRG